MSHPRRPTAAAPGQVKHALKRLPGEDAFAAQARAADMPWWPRRVHDLPHAKGPQWVWIVQPLSPGPVDSGGQYSDHLVNLSPILLDAAPALLFEMPPPTPTAILWARRRRAASRQRRELATARRLLDREAAAQRQCRMPWVTLPRTVGDCRGPGICPAIRCRYNLALWIKPNGAIKVGRAHQKGRTLTHKRGRRASDAQLEHAADLVVELADRLDSLCVLDYAEQVQWLDEEESYTKIAEALGCSKQRARTIVLEAMEDYDIAAARLRRSEMRERQARSPLVNIRKRPGPPMQPTARELDRVGEVPRPAPACPALPGVGQGIRPRAAVASCPSTPGGSPGGSPGTPAVNPSPADRTQVARFVVPGPKESHHVWSW